MVGYFAVLAAIVITWIVSGGVFAAIVAFVTVTAGLTLYERRYSRAAGEARQRLG